MTTRYDNHGTAHAFAHASEDGAGQSHNGNFYFQGNVLYSYGSHYPVAVILDRAARVALFNADPSSPTTEGKHKNAARRALSHFALTMVPDLDHVAARMSDGKLVMRKSDLLAYVASRSADIEKLRDAAKRLRADWKKQQNANEIQIHENAARMIWKLAGRRGDCFNITAKETRDAIKARNIERLDIGLAQVEKAAAVDLTRHVADLEDLAERVAVDASFGHLSNRAEILATVFPDLIPAGMSKRSAVAAKGKAWVEGGLQLASDTKDRNEPVHHALLAFNRAMSARIEKENAEKVKDWLNGATRSLPHNVPMTLRIVRDELQTSQGARVPLPEAIALTRFAASCRTNGKEWRKNGERRAVGQFQVDRITENGDIVAGCHVIPWAAIASCVTRYHSQLPNVLKNAVLEAGLV